MDAASHNIKYIKIFLLIVFIAALVSLTYRAISLVQKSSFRHASFNLLLTNSDSYLVHIDRTEKKLTILKYQGRVTDLNHRNRISESMALRVPVDGSIYVKNDPNFKIEENFMKESMLFELILRPLSFKFDNVNSFDVLKFYFYSKQIRPEDRKLITIAKKDAESIPLNINNNLIDNVIFNEKLSVQVVNATDIDGLGAKASRMLKSLGYNVVSIDTGKEKKSSIKTNDVRSASVGRLTEIFNVPVVPSSGGSIADITVVLGEDIGKKVGR